MTLAIVTGAHGLAGELRVRTFTDDLAAYPTLAAGDRVLTVRKVKPGPGHAILRVAEVADRTAAEGLRGLALTVPRAALPPLADGEYYHADLIGLAAVSSDGEALGRVVAVENFGAGDVIEIARADGRTFMAPMRPEAVPEWDAERLIVDAAFVG